MTKQKPPKKAKKKGKVPKAPPPETGMHLRFDEAMTRIANAPWPPKK